MITSFVGMVGAKHIGSFAISFTKESILKVVSAMLGEEFTEIDDTVADAVGADPNRNIVKLFE